VNHPKEKAKMILTREKAKTILTREKAKAIHPRAKAKVVATGLDPGKENLAKAKPSTPVTIGERLEKDDLSPTVAGVKETETLHGIAGVPGAVLQHGQLVQPSQHGKSDLQKEYDSS
jgi:hypothetical protein